MAHLNKEAYDRKREWAARRMAKNSEVETLTESQHAVIEWLCSVRHDVHSSQEDFFYAGCGNYSEFWSYIEDKSGESTINRGLKNVGLPTINFNINMLDYRSDMDYNEDFWETQMTYDEAYEEVIEMAEKFNNKIEAYLLEIDKTHGTNYCPVGVQRLY
jgi:hypothetical protein